jgi:hypothetical protein
MGKKLADETIIDFVTSIGYTFLNFVDVTHRRLKVRCGRGHEYEAIYSNLKSGTRCRKCLSDHHKKDFAYIKEYVSNTTIKLLSKAHEYKNNKSLLRFKCNIKNHIYTSTWNHFQQGSGCIQCSYEERGKSKLGKNNSSWKGGVTKKELPLYDTYASRLQVYQDVFPIEENGLILVGIECTYCHKVYVPKIYNIKAKLNAMIGKGSGDGNFYCSEECKGLCPIHGQILWPKGHKLLNNLRPLQTEWKNLAIETKRKNSIDGKLCCEKCGAPESGGLIAHHIDPVINNPIESADIDNCLLLCTICDKKVHNQPGCTYQELKC